MLQKNYFYYENIRVETKSINFEVKDIDTSKRTAVIAHAVYTNIDLTNDISCKGMFDKTWKENKNIEFLFNHDRDQILGNVLRTFDDEEKAYTEVKFGNWTLGNDVLEMAESNVLRGASFGYAAEKKEFVNIKGKKVRKLKEVVHFETSLLTHMPANPLAGIVKLQKSLLDIEVKQLSEAEQSSLKNIIQSDNRALQELIRIASNEDIKSDLYSWITYAISRRAELMGMIREQLRYNSGELKELAQHAETLDKFCRNAKASDECIKSLLEEKENITQFISEYNTANTQDCTNEPVASIPESELLLALTQFNNILKS